jgi:DNA-binding CsgD family transcriptional regulator
LISPGTARIHVERILGKLGLTSRVQIATWIVKGHTAGRAGKDAVRPA